MSEKQLKIEVRQYRLKVGSDQKVLKIDRPTQVKILRSVERIVFGSSASFVHTQSTESSEWIVNHNLGVNPLALILDLGGNSVEAEVIHISLNQLRVYFNQPQLGQVRCI